MRIDVYVPLLLSLLLAVVSPLAVRYVAPAHAARALAVTGAVTAAASGWALALLAGTLVDESPPVVQEARERGLHILDPVPEAVAVAAAVLIAVGLYRLHQVVRNHRTTRRALQRVRHAYAAETELIVAASPVPQAFALPGTPGRILVTTAMLSGLDARERHVLLAHERAHLSHRHDRLRLLVDVTAALNPLLVPLRDAVAFLLERWADEHAADTVADRSTTARALARAALLTPRSQEGCALHFSRFAITRRVTALQTPPPSSARAWAWAGALLALGVVPALGAADATADFLHQLTQALPT